MNKVNVLACIFWSVQRKHIKVDVIYEILDCEPSFVWTLSFFSRKVDLLNLKLLNQAKNIPVVHPGSSNQHLRQISQGVHELWSDIQTKEQRLLLYFYIHIDTAMYLNTAWHTLESTDKHNTTNVNLLYLFIFLYFIQK